MNREQIVGLLRHILPLIGGMAIGAGYISEEDWGILSEELLKVAGPALTLSGLVWSFFDKTDKSIVEKAIDLKDSDGNRKVTRIECSDTKEGVALAESVPHEDVVTDVMDESQPYITKQRVAQAYPSVKKS